MRPSCTLCARKHLAQAMVLLAEARQGYPEHVWYAIGHLAEAGDELVEAWPGLANRVREQRKKLETSLDQAPDGSGHTIDFKALIAACANPGKPPLIKMEHAIWVPAQPIPPEVRPDPGRTLLDLSSRQPAQAPPTTSPVMDLRPSRCKPCEESAKYRAASARWATEPDRQRLVILTTLGDFNPSYSLVSVVLDQVRAAALIGNAEVILLIQNNADITLLPALPDNVTVLGIVPTIAAANDQAPEPAVEMGKTWLQHLVHALGKATVITHDLLFQSGFLAWAAALHRLAGHGHDGVRFFHVLHSSVGMRPEDPKVSARASVPINHTIVTLNHADVPYVQEYYRTTRDRIRTLLNPRDVRVFAGMPEQAATLTSRYQLHRAEYFQLYPLSAPRMHSKGLAHVVNIFAELHRRDTGAVRLVVADAHANGKDGQDARSLIRDHAQKRGLPSECLIFTSEALPDTAVHGLDAGSIRSLFQLANLFVFPTFSEAGSLVLLEAAMAGNLLVLNQSLPCLRDYVDPADALWIPFGSAKEAGGNWAGVEAVNQIIRELSTSMTNRSKRSATDRSCLERYAADLAALIRTDWP